MTDVRGYYALLGVTSTATAAEIKTAYYAKAKELHPDAGELGDSAAFHAVREAYHILGHRRRRASYDEQGDGLRWEGETLEWIPQADQRAPSPLPRLSWRVALAVSLSIALVAFLAFAHLATSGDESRHSSAKFESAEPSGPPALSRADAEADAAAAEALSVPVAPEEATPHRPAR